LKTGFYISLLLNKIILTFKKQVMKKTLKLLVFPVLIALVLFSCNKQEAADQDVSLKAKPTPIEINLPDPEDCTNSVDLIAGQMYLAGSVTVSLCTGGIEVKFETDDGWYLTAYHVEVVDDPNKFHMTNTGNPKVGRFDYVDSFEPTQEVTIGCIPVGDRAFVAAHAVVCRGEGEGGGGEEVCELDIATLCASLPATTNMVVVDGMPTSTMHVTLSGLGDFPAWCVNSSKLIAANTSYSVGVVSTLCGGTLTGIVAQPANIGLLTYLLNQHYVGKAAGSNGSITALDVQAAIWKIIDIPSYPAGFPSPNEPRVNWILNDVAINGPNYELKCDDLVPVFLVPPESTQVIMIALPVPCDCIPPPPPTSGCETAWGQGWAFPGSDWSMFFEACLPQ
jgi:hypothetical protein